MAVIHSGQLQLSKLPIQAVGTGYYAGTASLNGSAIVAQAASSVAVSNSLVDSNSLIFVSTRNQPGVTGVSYSASITATGSIMIYSSTAATSTVVVNYMVISA